MRFYEFFLTRFDTVFENPSERRRRSSPFSLENKIILEDFLQIILQFSPLPNMPTYFDLRGPQAAIWLDNKNQSGKNW